MKRNRTILIVDADHEFTDIIAGALLEEQCSVEIAHDVQTGVSKFRQHAPDIIVAAAQLPGGGADQLQLMIRRLNATVPMLFVAPEDTIISDALSADLLFCKPRDNEILLAAIHRMTFSHSAAPIQPASRPTYEALVVEDEPDHREMIADCFARNGRENVSLVFVRTCKEACEALRRHKYAFVLLDHNLPDGTGAEILEDMEEQLLTTPVIGLSTSSDPQVALADFRGGALEFIEKHEAFQGMTLRRRVFEVLARHKRRAAASAMERRRALCGIDQSDEQLIAAARTDSMLGVFNRAAFDDVHYDAHLRAQSGGGTYGLCMIDVDRFKSYNDHYGHAAGDAVLKQVAKALGGAIRPEDTLARYGGEELVVVLDELDVRFLEMIAQRICDSVSALKLPHEHNDDQGCVTISVGAVAYDLASGASAADVLKGADAALYEAKDAGRNGVRLGVCREGAASNPPRMDAA